MGKAGSPLGAELERPRVQIGGVEIDAVTEQEAVDRILGQIAQGQGGWVVTPNLDVLRKARRDPSIRLLIRGADLALADGMPLVWASRLQGRPLPGRVPGSGLIWSLSRAAARAGASVFLLGGNPGTAEKAASDLGAQVPGLNVKGHHCPPFGFEDSEAQMQAVISSLEAAAPDIVYCGLGFPKQERLIAQLRERFPATWFLGVGISLSFVAGEVSRAPAWMQERGLEWLHRLTQEPQRLFYRYVVQDLPFAFLLLGGCILAGPRRKGTRPTW